MLNAWCLTFLAVIVKAHNLEQQPGSGTHGSSCQPFASTLPSTPLTNDQQVGSSKLGALSQSTFPKWLDGTNNEPYPDPPWGERTTRNADATVQGDVPTTNVARYYNFTISRSRLSPDGVLRDVIVINNQFPGPIIEANWGDWIEVSVHNKISDPEEATALHWHGLLQRGTQWEDGTPGVSQCPIAPGHSYTYRFRAEVYGSSFYHAHYSAQYTAGMVGAMQIYGPWEEGYDVDLGPVMLSDWIHIPYFSMVSDVVGSDPSKIPPLSDSGLINGRGRFDCSKPSYENSSQWLGSNLRSNLTWTCIEGAERAKFRFQSGKTHRLRLMNTGADGIHKFSIDGHIMTVIATDYVPTKPYTTDLVTLGVGQRTDVLITTNADPKASYWMRSHLPGGPICGGLGTPPGPDGVYPEVLAAIYHEDADTTIDPVSISTVNDSDSSCENRVLDLTEPAYQITPSPNPYAHALTLTLDLNTTGHFEWLINDQTYHANFNEPLLYKAATPNSHTYTPMENIYNFHQNTSILLNVTNWTPFPHPFHLHGHTFYVLNVGTFSNVWDGSIVNPANAIRRDFQIVPAGGYAALQFEADNPGVWPFHCHAAWHLSGGLSVNLLTRPEEIQLPEGMRERTCEAWEEYSRRRVFD
ncbi:hypothetical protein LTR37_009577 [Vermiconidia calcicola]|uniref:Uncharacterized protein n=1 Tax=Vermiconidia calcicola TaxID=1690605 RepID=A0ACC3N945_9PEZI|nr:hypothetical protein LTR37_009577 [Vermiconidia calcicola]